MSREGGVGPGRVRGREMKFSNTHPRIKFLRDGQVKVLFDEQHEHEKKWTLYGYLTFKET